MKTRVPEWAISHFSNLTAALNGNGTKPLHSYRKKSFEQFKAVGIPSKKNEEWKYTSLDFLYRENLNLVSETDSSVNSEFVSTNTLSETCKLVFVNGVFSKDLSSDLNFTGLTVNFFDENSSDSFPDFKVFEGHSGLYDLNGSFMNSVISIKVDKSYTAAFPLEFCYIATSQSNNKGIFPRTRVTVEDGASLSVIERYCSTSNEVTNFTNSVTEVILKEQARLEHCQLNLESAEATHVSTLVVSQGENSHLKTYTFSLGGKISRNEIYPTLNGSKIYSEMFGLSVLNKKQQVDNFTVIDHAKPHSESNELFKGIYTDQSRGNFSGTIIVRPDAQLTNAIQSSQSLLLSESALSNSRPQLKIWADDVKCTHGATVGQIDEDALFYLKSRGISDLTAKQMLILAFAGEILSNVTDNELRSTIETIVQDKLNKCFA